MLSPTTLRRRPLEIKTYLSRLIDSPIAVRRKIPFSGAHNQHVNGDRIGARVPVRRTAGKEAKPGGVACSYSDNAGRTKQNHRGGSLGGCHPYVLCCGYRLALSEAECELVVDPLGAVVDDLDGPAALGQGTVDGEGFRRRGVIVDEEYHTVWSRHAQREVSV